MNQTNGGLTGDEYTERVGCLQWGRAGTDVNEKRVCLCGGVARWWLVQDE